ncbi:Response regulator [Candidatus Terasakiella magnetica]|nr:Response regulator [Candidatus Terasakiella magnetica]
MIRLANVLVVHADTTVTEALLSRLSHNGYHGIVARSAGEARAYLKNEHPDLILVGDIGEDPVAVGGAIKGDTSSRDIPVVVMAERVLSDLALRALEVGLDDTISWEHDDIELFARLRPLIRLATMHAELRQRASIATGFGVSARDRATLPEGTRPSILVAGPDHDNVSAILGVSAEIVSCGNLYDAESLLESRNFDAAVVTTEGDIEGYLAFTSQVRNNPRLFNLPMVVVADRSAVPSEIYRRGASRVLSRPVDSGILRASVLSMVHRQQLRWSIRAAMFDSLKEQTRDPLTGVYTRDFLDKYLEDRLNTAKAHDRHLSVVFFYIPNIDGVRTHFGEDAAEHLAQQLGQWITGLLRAEDMTALYGRNEFCVVLPDTPLVEAEVVMHRIAGVLAYTDFAVREVYQPVKVWVQVGSTDAKNDDTLASLVSRARAKLD